MKRRIARAAAVLMLLGFGSSLLAAERQETVMKRLGDDLFAAGSTLNLTERAAGDVLAAGSEITTNAPIDGDAVLAGRRVFVSGPIAGSLMAVGAEVRVDRRVEHSARLAGREVTITSQGEVGRGVSVAAARFLHAGRAGAYLQVAAARAQIDGSVGGDVEVAGNELLVGPQAVIDGKLTFRGPRPPEVASGARIAGGVQHIPAEQRREGFASGLGGSLLWLLGSVLLGALLLWRWPAQANAAGQLVATRPGLAALLGLAVLVGGPILLVVLFVTVIGIPVGLVLLLAWLLLLPLGYLAAAFGLASRLPASWRLGPGDRLGRRVGLLAAVLLGLALVGLVPVLGGLVQFIVLLLGIGALIQLLLPPRGAEPAAARAPGP